MITGLNVLLWVPLGVIALAAAVIVGCFLAEFTSTLYAAQPAPKPSKDWYWEQLRHAQAADRNWVERGHAADDTLPVLAEIVEHMDAPETEAEIAKIERVLEALRLEGPA